MTPATKTLSLFALSAAALAAGSLAAPTPASAAEGKTNRNGQVTVTGNGSHTLGNPAAPVKVTEYISYTCSHCAALHREADPVLRTTAIPQGKVALTVSNLVRNPVDITIALLTSCGDPKTFFVRHNAFLASQDTWLPKAASASEVQRKRWAEGELPQRLRAIASDLGFYEKVEHFGVTRSQADQCLADTAQLDKVMAQHNAASQLKLTGTPGIVINGKVLYATKDGKVLQNPMGGPLQATQWKDMSAAISKALAASTAGQI